LAEIVVIDLGSRDSEASPGRLEEVADDRALLLEGAAAGKVELDLQRGDMHRQARCADGMARRLATEVAPRERDRNADRAAAAATVTLVSGIGNR